MPDGVLPSRRTADFTRRLDDLIERRHTPVNNLRNSSADPLLLGTPAPRPPFSIGEHAMVSASIRGCVRWMTISAAILGLSAKVTFATPVGSVFVTGHDPDFHATLGATLNAQHIIQDALTFVRNGNTLPVLLLESNLNNIALGDHTDSEAGIVASGYTA